MSIHQSYSKLLINEEPLQVLPSLALEVGLHEAIVLQQVHYWLGPKRKAGKVVDGTKWIFNSYSEWHEQFPFLTEKVIGNAIRSLERQGYLLSRQDLNSIGSDRRKWYTINYNAFEDSHSPNRDVDHPPRDDDSLSRDVVNRSTENTSENTTDTYSSDDENDTNDGAKTPTVDDLFQSFWESYPRGAKPTRHSKKESLAKFKVAIKKASVEEIMSGLEWFKVQKDWTKDNGEWIPGAQKWLHQEMWESAKDQPRKPVAQGGGQVVRKADKNESQKAWDDIMKPYYEGTHEN